jgi:peptidoglycan/xylan/chitin deacetylase (PgdA/CDA1 family)
VADEPTRTADELNRIGVRSPVRRFLVDPVLPFTTMVGSVVGVRTRAPHFVLTLDDGPEPDATERVLDALAQRRATATFFVLVGRAERHRTLLAETIAAGHEIALHGVDHRRLTRIPHTERVRGLAEGKRRLEDLVQQPIRWFRPPYGAQSPRVWSAIRRQGMDSVLWTAAAGDWIDAPVHRLVEVAVRGAGPGSVLLAHDGFAGAEEGADDGPPPRFDRGALVSEILTAVSARGLVGRSLSDALRHGEPRMQAWFLP